MQPISTPNAPAPGGHYAQAIVHGGVVYVSGQLPVVPGAPAASPMDFEAQARQVIRNVIGILEAAGSDAGHLVKVTVYIADIAHWPAFNKVYAEMLGGHRPARTVVPVPGLHYGFLVEMDAVAAIRDS